MKQIGTVNGRKVFYGNGAITVQGTSISMFGAENEGVALRMAARNMKDFKPVLRNWIEKATGKQWMSPPCCTGKKGGMDVYKIDWFDGTSQSYFIDWEEETIREVWPGLVRSTSYPYDIISQ